MSYKLKEKTTRNHNLMEMAEKNPDMTDNDLGKVFHITKQRVGQIKKRAKLQAQTKAMTSAGLRI